MKTGASTIVLDSWALLAYLNGEPAAQHVRQVLRKARKGELSALLSMINFGECLYMVELVHGLQAAKDTAGDIDQLAIQLVEVDRRLVFDAAHLKARYPISYADAFAGALAKGHDAPLMTGDPEFKVLETEITIQWLPRK